MKRNVEIFQREIPADFWQAMKDRDLVNPDYDFV